MPRFRFRLEKVLGLRERAERETARRLGEVLSRRQACLRQLEEMSGQRRGLLYRRDDLQRGVVRPPSLTQNRYQLIVLDRAINLAQKRLVELDRELRAAQAILMERSRERKLMEKLKDRRRREFELEQRRIERRELDERPQQRHGMAIAMSGRSTDKG